MSQDTPGFFVEPFAIDGESEGISRWKFEKLSAKWLRVCDEQFQLHGDSFDKSLGGPLSHIQIKFTSASGAALVTFSVHGNPAISIALASGASAADSDVIKMFVESLRRVSVVRQAASSPEPFQKMSAIKERPVMIVVPWPDDTISEQDHALARELAVHIAGAFFIRNKRPS